MYRVLLADDEGIVIEALRYIIEKNFGEQCTIEHAKTGRSVIELAEHFRPDIAFMDIQMPGINGIEAMKEIRKGNPNTVFIVISAYDKFDYARESIGLGVLEYVNKPIEQERIVELLKQAMAKVDTERENRSRELMIREKMETVVPIIESGLIYSILFEENYADDTENYRRLLGIEEDYGFIMVIQCGEAQEGNHLTNAVGSSVRAQSRYMEIREIIKEFFQGVIGAMMANMVVVFVPSPQAMCSNEEEYEQRVDVIEKARKMARKLKKRIDAQFRIGIGAVKKLKEAGESYAEAMHSFRYSTGSVAHVKDLPIGCGYEADYPIDTEKALFEAVSQGDMNGALLMTSHFFDWMIGNYGDCIMDIKLKVLEFVLWAEHIEYDSGGMTYHFRLRQDYLQNIMDMNNYEELRAWFNLKIQEACRNINTKKEESGAGVVVKAKEYIKSHYQRDISLDDVSKEVNISPYYFSKLFKEKAGENFIEYVTRIRMDKAKELLNSTDKSMKEICSEVGYSDSNYFSRSFKKNVGVTPTEYKEGK